MKGRRVNTGWWIIVGLWVAAACCSATVAQQPGDGPTLTERLLKENAASLARDAREKGSAIRGAILFPQKKLNCANCHSPGSRDMGPNLTEISKDVPDELFVQSILQPSKTIKKGFESVKVLTIDGNVIVGRVVSDKDSELVLRDPLDAKKLTRLSRSDVDQMSPNDKSTMPEGLADQLQDRQQFLDLVKYLMEIAATSKPAEPNTQSGGSGRVDARIRGLALIDHFGCKNCHRDGRDIFPPKRGPNLHLATSRIRADYIERFITAPHSVKPGTSMPDVMRALGEEEKAKAAGAITQYLLSLNEKSLKRSPVARDSVGRGRELFHTVGCVACHSPRDSDDQETRLIDSVALGDVADKYSLDGLVAFLENPHNVRPTGRMPNMNLLHEEAVDIAGYLLSRHHAESNGMEQDASLAGTGKQHFQQLGCAHCHQLESQQPASTFKPLVNLNPSRGCLSREQGEWPSYQFDDSQRDDLKVALAQSGDPLTDAEAITLTMQAFRCYACHNRDGIGGVSLERDLHFHTSDQNLGPQGRIPPTLTGVGAKLNPDWLRDVLVSGRLIRPYIKTRMPQYGTNNVQHLIDLFGRVDRLPDIAFGTTGDEKETRRIGTELVGNGGLNCIVCHTYRLKPSQTMSAVDLTEMGARLQKKWFYHYMQTPQQLSPQTVMPSFWPGGNAIRKDIADGDMKQQLEAIWVYLQEGRQARTPRGLIQKPIELLATDRAVMLRRSYQSIGKRGIGVGYPGGVNLAFDAEQMRLGMIWKGGFADPGGVWRGQGSGTVRPLGREVIRFAGGPELDDAQSPWIVDDGRPPRHQFTGYFLDQLDRPTFTYRFEQIEIEDYPINVTDELGETSLLRTLTFKTDQPRNGVVFRAASGDRITSGNDGSFLVGDKLTVRIEGRPAKIEDARDGKQLIIPIDLPAGTSQLDIEYKW